MLMAGPGNIPQQRRMEKPASKKAGQGQGQLWERTTRYSFAGAQSAPSSVKGTTSSDADFNGSRSVTAQFGLGGTDIPGVAVASPLPQ